MPFQSDDIFDPNNYRGITFTNAVGKHFDKIMDIQLDFFWEKYYIIDDCQTGINRKARTSGHVYIFQTIIVKYCSTKDGRMYAFIFIFKVLRQKIQLFSQAFYSNSSELV